jgi:hypothetical protein
VLSNLLLLDIYGPCSSVPGRVAVRAGLKVLMKVDSNSGMIVGNPQGILGQQLRTHPIYLFNITMMISITN